MRARGSFSHSCVSWLCGEALSERFPVRLANRHQMEVVCQCPIFELCSPPSVSLLFSQAPRTRKSWSTRLNLAVSMTRK